MAEIIDGKSIALQLRQALLTKVQDLQKKAQRPPALAVVLVGEDEASHVYVGHKEKACAMAGIRSHTYRLPADTSEEKLLKLIDELNSDTEVDGILVQLPLPAGINRFRIVNRIAPQKDIDGLGPHNQGLLALNLPCFIPCTPLGVMELLKAINYKLDGKHAVVVGRSLLVGAPMVRLLTHANATVTNVHSRTPHPGAYCQEADVLIVAAGVHHLVNPAWVKEGAVVIDVGIHRVAGSLQGDVDFAQVKEKASYITPVPGGVGPMTIACLLANCVKAFEWRLCHYQGFGEI